MRLKEVTILPKREGARDSRALRPNTIHVSRIKQKYRVIGFDICIKNSASHLLLDLH